MFFWIVLLIVITLLLQNYTLGGRTIRKESYIAAWLVITLISSIRFDIGFDYLSYWEMVANRSIQQEEFFYLEPTIRLLIKLARGIDSPPFLIITYAVITNTIIFTIIWRYSKNPCIGILVYIAFFYLPTLGFIRQGAALAIILSSYPYLIHSKPLKFCLTCIVASLFHYPALVALIIFPLYKLLNWKKLTVILFVFAIGFNVIISFAGRFFPQISYLNYIESLQNLTGGAMARLVFLCLILFLGILAYKNKKYDNVKLVLISLIGVITSFALGGHIGGRIGWYFLIFLCLSAPNIIMDSPKLYQQILSLCLCVTFIATLYVSTQSDGKHQYTPFRTIFQINEKTIVS